MTFIWPILYAACGGIVGYCVSELRWRSVRATVLDAMMTALKRAQQLEHHS